MKLRKILKIGAAVVLTPILLFLILTIIIYIPAVQNALVTKVAEVASEQTGMDIKVGKVCLSFPLDLSIENVSVIKDNKDKNGRDTVADISQIVADVRMMPLFRGQVDIEAFTFNNARVNTSDLVAAAIIKGEIKKFYLQSKGVDLTNDSVMINRAALESARLTIQLTDSVTEEDTVETENDWKIHADDIAIEKSDLNLIMSGDTLNIGAGLGRLQLNGADIDLGRGIYAIRNISADDSRITYDNKYAEAVKGFDYNHITLSGLTLALDSLLYSDSCTHAQLHNLSFREKSGLVLESLRGSMYMDSTYINVPHLECITGSSDITMRTRLDFRSLNNGVGSSDVFVNGYIGKNDIMLFLGDMPEDFRRQWPSQPLRLNIACSGNVNRLDVNRLALNLPSALNIKGSGKINNLSNSKRMRGNININMDTYDLGFVTSLIEHPVIIPHMSANADVNFNGSSYSADMLINQGDSGVVAATASYDMNTEVYDASVDIADINVHDFLPSDSIFNVDAVMSISGNKTDVFDKRAGMDFNAQINRIVYGSYDVSSVDMSGRLENGRGIVDLSSDNALMKGRITVDALLDKKDIRTTLACDIININLKELGIYDEKVEAGICAHIDLATDMSEYLRMSGFMNDITIAEGENYHRPSGIVMNVNTSADTTYADVKCGDFNLFVDADGSISQLITVGDTIMNKLNQQFAARLIDQKGLISCLPHASIRMNSGNDNFFAKVMKYYGMEFEKADMNLDISPATGINGTIDVNAMKTGDALLDSINFAIISDSTECKYKLRVKNNLDNPRYVFTAISDGYVFDRGLGCNLKYVDRTEEVGLDIGLKASMHNNGILFEVAKLNPVVGYMNFRVNEGNHVFLDHAGKLHADVKVIAEDGTGLMVYTNENNYDATQDITLSMHKMDLGKIFSVMPYMPKVTGVMNGDLHFVQAGDVMAMSSDLRINDMTYEESPMGNVGAELVYMPKNDGSHFINGNLLQNDRKIVELSGTYNPQGDDNFDLELKMLRFPMDITNGFFPYHLIGLHGYAEGDLTLKGSMARPKVDGELYLDSSYVESVPFGVEMRFANDPVRIVNSNLLFENFELFSYNDNPLVLYGKLDFANLDDILIDMKMQAHDFMLIDAKEKKYSVAYGKALVDFYGMMKGPLSNLKTTGLLEVSGNTDLVYILRESPLSADNRMDELVKFVNFQDTARVEKERPELSGLDMDMHVVVEDGAHIVCNLNADKTNYIDLMGGGRLRMQYNALDDLRLTGRYTLNSGEMKYSLPVIPLKTFAITDGSYVEFTGDAMNPRLNITATEKTSASVSGDDGASRTVEFECGVEVTRTLNDMGLKFIISAPEDMSVQNQLAAMSEEQRGKLAVTMLTTGMYLSDGNTSAFSMNNALSSFLQSEINQIASNAMKTMDVSVGVDNSTNAAGEQHTDYSFKFAKRFWNNRMKIIVGGSVSTGAEMENTNNSFFDNVSFEYRLDKKSSKNLRLFYERDSYDLLEGEISEYGVGFVWRKRMRHFMDLFRKEKKVRLFENERKDTVKIEK